MTTHRNTADYFAGIPRQPDVTELTRKLHNKAVLIDLQAKQIDTLQADLNAAKAAAWDEGMNAGLENVARRAWEDGDLITNPYREVS